MRDEVTGDCAAKRREKEGEEGGEEEAMVQRQGPFVCSARGEHESTSAETGQIHRNSHRAKGMGK